MALCSCLDKYLQTKLSVRPLAAEAMFRVSVVFNCFLCLLNKYLLFIVLTFPFQLWPIIRYLDEAASYEELSCSVRCRCLQRQDLRHRCVHSSLCFDRVVIYKWLPQRWKGKPKCTQIDGSYIQYNKMQCSCIWYSAIQLYFIQCNTTIFHMTQSNCSWYNAK